MLELYKDLAAWLYGDRQKGRLPDLLFPSGLV